MRNIIARGKYLKSGDFCENNVHALKKITRNHDWPNFSGDMQCIDRCSEAFLQGYHSFPLLLNKWSIWGCKMLPRTCYQIFREYQLVSPGFWGGFGDENLCPGKVGKMSLRQNDCTGKKTFWKVRYTLFLCISFRDFLQFADFIFVDVSLRLNCSN